MLTNKKYKLSTLTGLMILLLGWACSKDSFIDPITPVEPGADAAAPAVVINYPVEGTKIKVLEAITTIDIKFQASDDIELSKIVLELDGKEIGTVAQFVDYRKYAGNLVYDQLATGVHSLSVTAFDLSGKTTKTTVNFEKEAPYVPLYEGEILYMPFDNDYIDLVSISRPTVTGAPKFSEESLGGTASYQGAAGSYLSFDAARFQNTGFTAAFWMKVNASPDRAGILVMGPPDSANPDAQNNRKSGFRFFRENAGGKQRFKLNVGNGGSDHWIDGGAAADVVPNTDEWTHFAFTISGQEAIVYIDGELVKQSNINALDWTDCNVLSIMSGEPRFAGWNHKSDQSLMDELRIFDRALSLSDIRQVISDDSGRGFGYTPKYDGEVFYLPFEGDLTEKVSNVAATVAGGPAFATTGKVGLAYAGAPDAYLTFDTDDLTSESFSASFWLNINATPDRAGILVMGPPDDANPTAQNNRKSGFRFFRENAGGKQRFKLNAGNGAADSWFDGGASADVEPNTGGWTHFAFTISPTESVVYINGEVAKQGAFSGIDWTGCNVLSIMSGDPRFTGWGHKSDESLMDELRLFNKALTQDEVKQIILDEQ
ncbi:MAG: Ig-like domain-containing protein [Saprospiraceae bacterium]|nr:Ig-like domain-containing protein [Saprospiraceae bacterium]